MQRDLELRFRLLFFLFVTIIRKLVGSHEKLTPEQCCGSGSGIRCLFDPWFGIRDRFFPDPELGDNFLNKKFYNSLKIGPNVVLQQFKNKININFVKFVATKKV